MWQNIYSHFKYNMTCWKLSFTNMFSVLIKSECKLNYDMLKTVTSKYSFISLHITWGGIFCDTWSIYDRDAAEGLCWAWTAVRQTSRLRREYLKAVLRQDVGLYDSPNGASTTYEIVSSISSDTLTIQDVISEKVLSSCILFKQNLKSQYPSMPYPKTSITFFFCINRCQISSRTCFCSSHLRWQQSIFVGD